ILNGAFSPIVLVLDDLQWADVSSLQVIDYLVSDMQNTNQLMIIGCYRAEELLEKGDLVRRIDFLKEKKSKYSFNITEIELVPCQADHVNKMIMSIMSIDDESETKELADLCYRRTFGNPFFVLQFMSMLEYEGLITYTEDDGATIKWSWKLDEIELRTKFTSNVVELLQGRMRKMSEELQLLMQYAACLGTSFTKSTIDIIWKQHGIDDTGNTPDLSSLLEQLQEVHFIEECGDNYDGYRWTHDKVQEAAISLSEKVNASFKFRIGKTLLSALDDEHLEDDLFDVVDLINRGNVATRPELAVLNLRAAEKAYLVSAYQSASSYIEFGAAMLPRDHWTTHREVTLDLYTLGAEVELALGNNEAAAGYCNAVFQRNDCTKMEKVPLRMVVIEKLSGGDSVMKQKALELCLEALAGLNYPLIRCNALLPLQALLALVRTVKTTKKWLKLKDSRESLSEMTDPRHLAIMKLLERVSFISYQLELTFVTTVANCHQVKMTLKHGKCDLSARGFITIGVVSRIVLKEDLSFAVTCARFALKMEERYADSRYEGQTIWSAHVFCLCWNDPLQTAIDPLLYSYKSSMRNGDTEFGMWIVAVYEHQRSEPATWLKMMFQLFLILGDESATDTLLKGSVFDDDQDLANTPFLLGLKHFAEGELLIHSSTGFSRAAERAINHGDKFQELCPALFLGLIEMFHRGVALYAMARQEGKRKFRTRASKIRKRIKQWIKDGTPNIEHYDFLLDAEHASLRRKNFDEADGFFLKAIETAVRLGDLRHSGLCNERYADFLLHCRSDKPRCTYRLSQAIGFYQEWGANGKVHQLKLQMHF
ncbi:MAG: hypothetical protein SGBAC_012957, partial [Bacillariaceae sp.]